MSGWRPTIGTVGAAASDVGLGVFAFAYLAYPVVAAARAAITPRPYRTGSPPGAVSVVIAAHDEEADVAAKLDSVVVAARSVSSVVEVVVADDGSSDRTVDEAEAAAARAPIPIRVLRLPRGGKAAALEAAVRETTGDLLVFTDANSMLGPDSLRHLLEPFADGDVGGVAGDQVYDQGSGTLGERLHWTFDRWLKTAESAAGSTVSATGALYAVRRRHFSGVPADVTDDFFISTGVVAGGERLVFAPGAVVTEPAAETMSSEYARKVRVMTRGLRGVVARRQLLAAGHGFYAVSFLSRKVVRRLSGPALLVSALGSAIGWRQSSRHRAVAAMSATIAAVGTVGLAVPQLVRGRPWIGLPAFVCASVAASTQALFNVATGVRITRWERPSSGVGGPPGSEQPTTRP